MKKNAHIHIVIETELLEDLKKQAHDKDVHLSEICRQKLREGSYFNKIEMCLQSIEKKLSKNHRVSTA